MEQVIESRFSLSLWVLTEEGYFADSCPSWESEPATQQVVQPAYEAMTAAVARLLCGFDDAYAVSLDKLDEDGIGVCQSLRTLDPSPLQQEEA